MLMDQGNRTGRVLDPSPVGLVFYFAHEADIHNRRCHTMPFLHMKLYF